MFHVTPLAAGIFLCVGAAVLTSAGCRRTDAKTALPMERAIEKQRQLTAREVAALQDLRLIAAVQTVHYSRNRRYATPEALKAAGMLDSAWPRSAPSAYQVQVELTKTADTFEVFADPVEQGLGFYRIDETQVVRTERTHRPTRSSSVF